MPRPLTKSQRYMPGLDGLRAIAVLAVIAYHLGVSWLPGGLLGVGVFFTLSGYLITDLLLTSWRSTGTLQLRTFWVHRARRLLPALFVMLPVVIVWVALADPHELGALQGQAIASVFYVANWWLIAQHVSYFARFGPPSPLGHLWSLSVEEQFYLVWPWLLALGLAAVTRWRRSAVAGSRSAVAGSRSAVAGSGAAVAGSGAGRAVAPAGGVAVGAGSWPAGGVAVARVAVAGGVAASRVVAPARRGADLHALGNLLSGRTLHAGAGEPAARVTAPGVVGSGSLAALAVATVVLAAASAVEMALLYHPGFNPSRLYDGTDTRAFGLLLGAALAMLWPSRELSERIGGGARLALEALGVAGLAGIGVLMWQTDQYSPFLYPYGMVLLSLATVMVVAAVAHPATRVGRALGWAPLRWVGSRSYAIYLWHYPVIILTDPKGSAPPGVIRDLAQVAVTLALAELSWRLVETPARSGRVPGIQWRRPKPFARPRPGMVLVAVSVSAVIAAAVVAIPHLPTPAAVSSSATLPISSPVTTAVTAPPSTPPGGGAGRLPAGRGVGLVGGGVAGRGVAGRGVAGRGVAGRGVAGRGGSAGAPVGTPAGAVSPAPSRTRCTQVVHIGDSTSESLVSPAYLPDPAQRLGAQYARVGAIHSTMEISGGRSIVETLDGQPNGQTVAQGLVRSGYHGCWVVALGTNDAADVYVGSNVGDAQRIQRMMSVIGNQPVLWVDAVSLLSSGPYAEANMKRWNRALVQACRAYPNLAVFDWASLAQPSWFISDGVHYTSAGSAKRAAAFADALAAAFPARGPSATGADCVVKAAPNWYLPAYKG